MQPEVVVALVVTIIIAVVIVYLVLRPKTETLVPDRAELLAIENEWRAPAELASTGVPRAVRFERGTKVFFVCAVLLLFGAGVYVLREALHGVREFERVERTGVEGQAVVIRKWITRGKSGTRYAAYLFKVGGAAYQRRAELSRKAYGRVQPGDRVAVRYLPSDPSVSRLLVEERPALPDSLWGLGVFLFALAFALGLYVWNVLLLRRLLQWGQPVAAFVTHRSYVSGRGSHYYVRYRFLDTSGNPVDGHERLVYDAPRLRATVTVLYDPQKPSRNALYPFSFSGFEGISKGTPSPSEPVPEQPLTEHPAIPRVPRFRLDNVDQSTWGETFTFPVSPDKDQTVEGPSWLQDYVLEAGVPAPGVAAILDFYENAFKERGGMVVYRNEKRRTITLKMPFEDRELWLCADVKGWRSQKISVIIVETGRLSGKP